MGINKADRLGLIRQLGQQGRQSGRLDVHALTASIFATVTNRAYNTKQGRRVRSSSSLPKLDVYACDTQNVLYLLNNLDVFVVMQELRLVQAWRTSAVRDAAA